MQVLDDLGDKSSPEKRQEYFEEIDEDGSGAIDFEEFMGVSVFFVTRALAQFEILVS